MIKSVKKENKTARKRERDYIRRRRQVTGHEFEQILTLLHLSGQGNRKKEHR